MRNDNAVEDQAPAGETAELPLSVVPRGRAQPDLDFRQARARAKAGHGRDPGTSLLLAMRRGYMRCRYRPMSRAKTAAFGGWASGRYCADLFGHRDRLTDDRSSESRDGSEMCRPFAAPVVGGRSRVMAPVRPRAVRRARTTLRRSWGLSRHSAPLIAGEWDRRKRVRVPRDARDPCGPHNSNRRGTCRIFTG